MKRKAKVELPRFVGNTKRQNTRTLNQDPDHHQDRKGTSVVPTTPYEVQPNHDSLEGYESSSSEEGDMVTAQVPKRIRDFPHVPGNWPTFVCIEGFDIPTSVLEASNELLMKGGLRKVTLIDNPHLSLSKTFTLREHQIQTFVGDVRRQLCDMKSFSLSCRGFRLFFSENGSRVFSGSLVKQGRSNIIRLLERIDTVLSSYLKPVYYQDPIPHISLGWGFPVDGTRESTVETPGAGFFHKVKLVSIKVGNKSFSLPLLAA